MNTRRFPPPWMVALYVFDSKNKGINLLGGDSLIFNDMPSCFGCRINDILLLNVSSDFFCSKGCGMPYPASMKLLMGGKNGMMKLEGVSYAAAISNPVTDLKLFKPVVWLYQHTSKRSATSLAETMPAICRHHS